MSSYVPPPAKQLVARIKAMQVDESKVIEREQQARAPRRLGPLERGFSTVGLSRREKATATFVQTLMKLKAAVKADDRATYDKLVPRFDKAAAIIEAGDDAVYDRILGADSRDPDAVPYGQMIRRGFTDWE